MLLNNLRNLWNSKSLFCHNTKSLCFCFLTRAKLFRGKKIYGDYDIKVEQVRLPEPLISFLSASVKSFENSCASGTLYLSGWIQWDQRRGSCQRDLQREHAGSEERHQGRQVGKHTLAHNKIEKSHFYFYFSHLSAVLSLFPGHSSPTSWSSVNTPSAWPTTRTFVTWSSVCSTEQSHASTPWSQSTTCVTSPGW